MPSLAEYKTALRKAITLLASNPAREVDVSALPGATHVLFVPPAGRPEGREPVDRT